METPIKLELTFDQKAAWGKCSYCGKEQGEFCIPVGNVDNMVKGGDVEEPDENVATELKGGVNNTFVHATRLFEAPHSVWVVSKNER